MSTDKQETVYDSGNFPQIMPDQITQFFMNSPYLMCFTNMEGKFLRVNPSFSSALGWPTNTFLDNPLIEFVHPSDRAKTLEGVELLRKGKILEGFQNRYRCKDGTYRTLEWSAIPDVENQVIAAIARDITEELIQKAELQQSLRELEQFAYVASHDLQEPLRMIASYTQLLMEEYGELLQGEAEEYASYIISGANRMRVLIQDLLRLSRVDRRGQKFTKIDTSRVVKNVLRTLDVMVCENQAQVIVGELPDIVGDASQIPLVFQNIVTNALKYRRDEPPVVYIKGESLPGEYLFSISDNGIGIEKEYLERIFWVFHRLHSEAEYSGTGIGLAICEKIIERHSGRIWAESKFGEGTTFYFKIPHHKETE